MGKKVMTVDIVGIGQKDKKVTMASFWDYYTVLFVAALSMCLLLMESFARKGAEIIVCKTANIVRIYDSGPHYDA